MTPREKAGRLIGRFYFSLPNNGSFTGINNINKRWEEGKMCALIAVDEVINELDAAGLYTSYWYEVKQEIENYDKKHDRVPE